MIKKAGKAKITPIKNPNGQANKFRGTGRSLASQKEILDVMNKVWAIISRCMDGGEQRRPSGTTVTIDCGQLQTRGFSTTEHFAFNSSFA